MPAVSRDSAARRLSRVRATLPGAGADALVITHLPNICYLTGLAATAAAMVLTQQHAVLIVDARYATAARALGCAAEAGADGPAVEVLVAERHLEETIVETLRHVGPARAAVEAASMSVGRFNRLATALAGSPALVPTERLVESVRIVKDEQELAILREAGRRLSEVARDLRRLAVAGRTERAIAADIDAAMRAAGFERPAFETIVATGPNSALPHARPTGRLLGDGEGAVLDFGGVYDGYCVDLTRSLHLGARPAGLRRIFDAVVEAHRAAIAAVRPGVAASAIDAAARDGLAEAFGHGTGHGLGLEVHEEPRVTKEGTAHPDSVLETGMVFTIEPGAYVPGIGGVRIEDDVLVIDGGAELLTDVPIDW
jgi:Xaa-Pro aminopeptidase